MRRATMLMKHRRKEQRQMKTNWNEWDGEREREGDRKRQEEKGREREKYSRKYCELLRNGKLFHRCILL